MLFDFLLCGSVTLISNKEGKGFFFDTYNSIVYAVLQEINCNTATSRESLPVEMSTCGTGDTGENLFFPFFKRRFVALKAPRQDFC